MRYNRLVFLTFILVFIFSVSTNAHVILDFPVGGETFEANAVITIQWEIEIDHGPCNWDLYLSSDGGANFQPIVLDLPKTQLTYDWTVASNATQQAVIRVVQDNDNGTPYDDYSGIFTIDVPSAVTGNEAPYLSYKLFPAFPDPFNPTTTISYSIPSESAVSLDIYDGLGRLVKTLVNEVKEPGKYSITWDGNNSSNEKAAAGMYIYRMKAGKFTDIRKMILLK